MRNILIAAAALLGTTAVSAADFTGPWVEARGGWDSLQLKASDNSGSVSGSRSGFGYGAAAGYDFGLSATSVAGIQIGAYGTTSKVCTEVYGNDQACLKAGRDLEVLARLGLRAGDASLIYGLAGYANGKISATYVDYDNAANNMTGSATGGGIRVGAGIEHSFGKTYAKAEYRYTSYTKSDIGSGVDAGFNRHQLLFGLGYRF